MPYIGDRRNTLYPAQEVVDTLPSLNKTRKTHRAFALAENQNDSSGLCIMNKCHTGTTFMCDELVTATRGLHKVLYDNE